MVKTLICSRTFTSKKFLTTTAPQIIKITIHKNDWTKVLSKSLEILDKSAYFYFSFYKPISFIISQCLPKSKFLPCNLYSVYQEIPEEFLDETDVDSYSFHNILDVSQSHNPIVRVSKGSNKKSFAFKVFHFAIQSCSRDSISKKKSAFPKTKLSLYLTVWVNFSKLLIKPTKYHRFHYPNLNLRLDLQKQKTNCSVIATRI